MHARPARTVRLAEPAGRQPQHSQIDAQPTQARDLADPATLQRGQRGHRVSPRVEPHADFVDSGDANLRGFRGRKASSAVSPAMSRPARVSRKAGPTVSADLLPNQPVPTPIPRPARRAVSQLPSAQFVALRATHEPRAQIIAFLRFVGLEHEVAELIAIERRLHRRTPRDLAHAAFSARWLMRGVADHLFPPRSEMWRDRRGGEHKVGAEEAANRLSAFVEQQLWDKLEADQRRAFQGEIDALKRWTGRGPHGAHTPAEADQCYLRLLSIMGMTARAYWVSRAVAA